MPALTDLLTDIVSAAFTDAGLPAELGTVVRSDRPDLGQFQCNGALAAAKIAKAPPRKLADQVVEGLQGYAVFGEISLAGPGFINLTVTDDFLAAQANILAADSRLGAAETTAPQSVILDFGGPNIAKPMHVGHLRATIIGDCLQRLFRFAGHNVTSDVHMGDWGLPMGMLISEIAIEQPDLPYFDDSTDGPYPAESPVTMKELETLYPKAAADCKADPARLEAARQATADLQSHRPGYRALWRHFLDVSVAGMQEDFGTLGVRFDLWKGEAIVHDLIAPMVERMQSESVAVESDGAVVVAVAEDGDKTEIPPLILLKSDGGVMYGTTDLATILDRVQSYDPDLMLYVVDQRQSLHFVQVFRTAQKSGIAGKARLEHIGFGTMNGPDGKPFKTRAGGVMRLQDLIGMATEQAMIRLREEGLAADYPEDEREQIARMVGIAAIKFADLSNHRLSNYIFDLDRFTRFEGRTGPYLQYAAVRIKSLLRKAEAAGAAPGPIVPPTEVERDLVLLLGQLPDAVSVAIARRAPNELCDFAFRLAQEFSRFYGACHILSESDEALKGSRLALSRIALRELELLLSLLGIEIPEKM